MHLMLVNDDGIQAAGIRALAQEALAAGHRVSVCAPDRERSAASHAITLSRGLTAQRTAFEGAEIAYAVDGTPADCARLGLYLIPDVDVVLSGVNNGPNLGSACIYSGTVAAAMEASMSGTPAMAISLCSLTEPLHRDAARVAIRMLGWMATNPLPRGVIYNLNVPPLKYEQLRGVVAATLAPNYLDSPNYIPEETPEGTLYHYRHGVNPPFDDPRCDLLRVKEGFATLTKATWDLRMDGDDPDISSFAL